MRVTLPFNKMLAIPGRRVASVELTPEGIVVGVRRRFAASRHVSGTRRSATDATR